MLYGSVVMLALGFLVGYFQEALDITLLSARTTLIRLNIFLQIIFDLVADVLLVEDVLVKDATTAAQLLTLRGTVRSLAVLQHHRARTFRKPN